MADPFSKSASIRVKIRTPREFFQADATVTHSTCGLGVAVIFHAISPPFLIFCSGGYPSHSRRVKSG
jgi:hypothetical protein